MGAADILTHPERELSAEERKVFRRMVARRGVRREPLQYIVGEAEFFSRRFLVDRGVLIPRPETELLVEETMRRLSGWRHPVLADLGTGSGVLAVTLALELPGAEVHAVDISGDALAVASFNARRHGVSDRVYFYRGDLFSPLAAAGLTGKLDAVVSNPPYVGERELADLQPEVRWHEPREALVAPEDGLAFFRRMAESAPRFLRAGGWLLVEIGASQGEAVATLFGAAGFAGVEVVRDYSGRERIVAVRLPMN